MKRVLFSWLGSADLRGAAVGVEEDCGPVMQALLSGACGPVGPDGVGAGTSGEVSPGPPFDEAVLLSNYPAEKNEGWRRWAERRIGTKLTIRKVALDDPTDLEGVFVAAREAFEGAAGRRGARLGATFHTSPGTPSMSLAWVILAQLVEPAPVLLKSSREYGVKLFTVPFFLTAEFLPGVRRRADATVESLGVRGAATEASFGAMSYACSAMTDLVERARRAAPHTVPVLILGESGTGKELLARAIHEASGRRGEFVALNCGAIPPELVESELFGHEKGAFTGATGARPGKFEAASGGTLFLDEVGELPLPAQVKLLRALQERKVRRVGANAESAVDARVIAATNRDLLSEVDGKRFRGDLFHRLAVAVLKLPPLRERGDDLDLLVERLFAEVNRELGKVAGWQSRRLAEAAKERLRRHGWPGNVRELWNTLLRAALWARRPPMIAGEDVEAALAETSSVEGEAREAIPARGLAAGRSPSDPFLDRPLGDGFDVREQVAGMKRHYLQRALTEAGGNQTKAAKLLGLSRQVFTNWLEAKEPAAASRAGVRRRSARSRPAP